MISCLYKKPHKFDKSNQFIGIAIIAQYIRRIIKEEYDFFLVVILSKRARGLRRAWMEFCCVFINKGVKT